MKHLRWTLFRSLLLASGLGLLAYIAYRYSLFNPPDHGSLYGKIFPLSGVLAGLGITLAVRPRLFGRLRGQPKMAGCSALTAFGGAWMATGMMCVRSTAAAVVAAPLGGTFDMVHLMSDHLFLPVAVVALAWAPGWVAGRLGAQEEEPEMIAEPTLGAAGL
jgi:hypothetical protein